VIANAPWAARRGHTSVIDAAGAIYVIGGFRGEEPNFNDVWVSTDGGADRTRAGVVGGTACVLRGYNGVLLG
jgi:hypothetical protein